MRRESRGAESQPLDALLPANHSFSHHSRSANLLYFTLPIGACWCEREKGSHARARTFLFRRLEPSHSDGTSPPRCGWNSCLIC